MSKGGPVDGAEIIRFLEEADEYIVVVAVAPLDEAHGRVVGLLSGQLEALAHDPASPRLRADLATAVRTSKAAGLKPFGRHVYDGLSYIEFAEEVLNAAPGRPLPAARRSGLRQELDDHAKAMYDAAFSLNHPGVDDDVQAMLGELWAALEEAAKGGDVADRVRGLVAKVRVKHPTNPPMAPCVWLVTIAERWLHALPPPLSLRPGPGAAPLQPVQPFSLLSLESAVRANHRPPAEALRAGLLEALKAARTSSARPDYSTLMVAALLVGDAELRREVILLHHGRNLDAYHRQKDSGMDEEDLGDRPTEATSERLVGNMVVAWLEGMKSALAGELRNAPPPFELGALREWIERGATPGADELRRAVRAGIQKQRNAPTLEREKHFPALGVAALLAKDAALWGEVVDARWELEGDSYDGQQAAGVTQDDLGPRPTRQRSEGFVRARALDFLKEIKGALGEELRMRAKT